MNLGGLLFELIKRNPGIQQNPRAKSMLDVIASNNAKSGAVIADNLCREYGVTRDEAIKMAQDFFNLH